MRWGPREKGRGIPGPATSLPPPPLHSCAGVLRLHGDPVPQFLSHINPQPHSPLPRLPALLPPPRTPVPLQYGRSSCLNVPRGFSPRSLPNDPSNTRFRFQNYLDASPALPSTAHSLLSYVWMTRTLQNADVHHTYHLQIRFLSGQNSRGRANFLFIFIPKTLHRAWHIRHA